MTLIVSASDLHLDHRSNGVARFGEVSRGLWQAAQTAIDRKADLFVCPGDVSDPDSGAIIFSVLALCIDVMMGLERAGIPQLWVKGNHDGEIDEGVMTPLAALAQRLNSESEMSRVVVAERPLVWGGMGWKVMGDRAIDVLALPHGQYDAAAWVRKIAKCEGDRLAVVVSHLFPIPDMEPGEETSEMPRGGANPLPTEALAEVEGDVLVLSGHYHKRQVFRPAVGPAVHVVGSLCQLTHGEESNSPGFLVIEV